MACSSSCVSKDHRTLGECIRSKGIGAVGCSGERNIPDGEMFTCPVKDSVNGVIQFNCETLYRGTVFNGVRLVFKDGKIVEATAGETAKLNEILDSDEGARYIVGLRDLRDGSGRIIGAPAAFTSALAAKGHQRPPDPRTRSSAAQLTEEKAGDHLVLAAVTDDPHAGQYHRAKAPSRKPFRPSTGHVPRRRSSAESPGHMPSRRAEVTESRVANNVTSTPRATSPSASMPVTCSHGP